jgi:5'-deoxynucleotidase YfbR-like HD superfamily hydrolase
VRCFARSAGVRRINRAGERYVAFFQLHGADEVHQALGTHAQHARGKHTGAFAAGRDDRARAGGHQKQAVRGRGRRGARHGLAVYHEAGEVITGDLATPIKYFSPEIRSAYKDIERIAENKLVGLLPEELRGEFAALVLRREDDAEAYAIVKAADKICAYLKCVEELAAGNTEFARAKKTIEKAIRKIDLPEVKYFMETFAPSFELSLDEMG